jgi:DNA-nicking Smr family endonuclease
MDTNWKIDQIRRTGAHVMEPIEVPIDGTLDLHTFLPGEIPDLLEDYLNLCRDNRIFQVRVIHGKGKGILKARVRSLLESNPLVLRIEDAPVDAGGWGATIVVLKPDVS